MTEKVSQKRKIYPKRVLVALLIFLSPFILYAFGLGLTHWDFWWKFFGLAEPGIVYTAIEGFLFILLVVLFLTLLYLFCFGTWKLIQWTLGR